MPRTAGSFLFDILREAYGHNKRDSQDPRKAGEWHQSDSWIILTHEPILFRSTIENVSMITILRNPVEAIASQVFKTVSGFSQKTIAGRPEIVSENISFFQNNEKSFINESIYQECKMWEGYVYGALLSIDNIIPLTFEQVTKNTAATILSIQKIAGMSDEQTIIDDNYIKNHLNTRIAHAKSDINFTSGIANGLPVEKPKEYYDILHAVENFQLMPGLKEYYEEALKAFEKKGIELGILEF